jgi:ABC-type multidrug transport system fused ATPase/permease subunit
MPEHGDSGAMAMPGTLFGYIWRTSARHQAALAALSAVVFLLSAVPLELQRRIVNDALQRGATAAVIGLALGYAALALAEGGIKLGLNVYRGWVSERAVRDLRRGIGALAATPRSPQRRTDASTACSRSTWASTSSSSA